MGFGASTTVGNVAVDLVQADVDGIIAGIANGKALADIDTTLATIDGVLDNILFDTADLQYLYSSSASAGVADLLQYSGYSAGYYLSNIDSDLDYLYSSSAGYGVADLLYSSSSNTVADLLESIKTAVESLAGALSGGRLQVDDQH